MNVKETIASEVLNKLYKEVRAKLEQTVKEKNLTLVDEDMQKIVTAQMEEYLRDLCPRTISAHMVDGYKLVYTKKSVMIHLMSEGKMVEVYSARSGRIANLIGKCNKHSLVVVDFVLPPPSFEATNIFV